jgi:hypothetical protein
VRDLVCNASVELPNVDSNTCYVPISTRHEKSFSSDISIACSCETQKNMLEPVKRASQDQSAESKNSKLNSKNKKIVVGGIRCLGNFRTVYVIKFRC